MRKPWFITTSARESAARKLLPGYEVVVPAPPRPRGWEWLDRPFVIGPAWDRMIDRDRVDAYRHAAFMHLMKDGNWIGWVNIDRRPPPAPVVIDPISHEEFLARWEQTFSEFGARRGGKVEVLRRFLEECELRKIPVETEPDEVGTDIYSGWFENRWVEAEQRRDDARWLRWTKAVLRDAGQQRAEYLRIVEEDIARIADWSQIPPRLIGPACCDNDPMV